MGAKQELFEVMSSTPPNEMYVLTENELTDFGVTPTDRFTDFVLKAKMVKSLQVLLIHEMLVALKNFMKWNFCWKGKPTVNFYAEDNKSGLTAEQISFLDGGWRLFNEHKEYEFDRQTAKFYSEQRIMATLTLDKR